MDVVRFKFTGYNEAILPATMWLPEGERKAVLQVMHGMTEHTERFATLAQELAEHGIVVVGFDLRGHGRNMGDPNVASLGEGGWDASIEDMHMFFRALRKRFPDLTHYILGFSLGSFLLREYLGRYPDGVDGAIIVGTGYQPRIILSVMMGLVKGQIKKNRFDSTTELVQQLSFGAYNHKVKPNRTAADWLCADETQLDLYLSDPLCRKAISAGLFWQMLGSMKRTGRKDSYENWRKDMPVLLLSGWEDPVGDFGKGIYTLQNRMRKAGITRLSVQLQPHARHDVLHEEKSRAGSAARAQIAKWIILNQKENSANSNMWLKL